MTTHEGRTAFVLSGGGSLGAVQVGMLQTLGAAGMPDFLVGTSAGAVNAAWVAGHGMSADSLGELSMLWQQLRRRDVFPVRPDQVLRALLGGSRSVSSSYALGSLVRAHAGFADLAEASTEVHMVATDLLSGTAVFLSSGPGETAVRASAGVPGLFQPVLRDGHHLVDGGVANHSGIGHAVDLGASSIWVLPTGHPCALPRPPRTALGVALQALTLLIEQRLITDVANRSGEVVIKVLPPLCPLAVSATDFTRAGELVERARVSSARWLDQGGDDLPRQERFLSLHHHAVTGGGT